MSSKQKSHKSYNARYMDFEDVAKTFVPNSQFRELLRPESSIIVGPRGCGKTTLLKMLHPRAFAASTSEKVKQYYNDMNFWGVYIPADIQWAKLLEKVEKLESQNCNIKQLMVNTLISINVLSSICKCFRSLLELSLKQLEEQGNGIETETESSIRQKEVILSQDLISIWRIDKRIPPTLYGIQQYWNDVIAELDISINNHTYVDWILKKYNEFLHYSHAAFDAFQEHCKSISFCAQKNFNWALCFDELELAPDELRFTIFSFLRSTSYQNIIFKTTSSFLLGNTKDVTMDSTNIEMQETDAVEGHDYSNILNWVHDEGSEKQWEHFCDDLYSQRDEKKVIKLIGKHDLIRCFEDTGEFPLSNASQSDYKPGSPTYQLFVEYAKANDSFSEFLTERGIDPKDPYAQEDVKYNLLKKIKTSVICRYYRLKPRKITPFYFGKDILYDFSEGNPRLAINIMNRMISAYAQSGSLDVRTQSSVFHELSEDYMKFYKHYPNAEVDITSSKKLSLGELLKKTGEYFEANLYDVPFSEISKNTFYIDSQTPDSIGDLVNKGVELGAILKVDNPDFEDSVYKLAYILYPYFSLPKRLITTKPEKLSSILSSVINKDQLTTINKDQLTIPFNDDNK